MMWACGYPAYKGNARRSLGLSLAAPGIGRPGRTASGTVSRFVVNAKSLIEGFWSYHRLTGSNPLARIKLLP